jgi:hypothetical protein
MGPQQRAMERRAERLRRQRGAEAVKLMEKNPEFPSVQIQIHDKDREVERGMPDGANQRLSEPRLVHLLKFLDIRGEAYLRLVTDLESEKAFMAIMEDFVRATWWQFSGVPIESIPPTSPFAEPHPTQSQRDRVLTAGRYWVTEGYRRIAPLPKDKTEDQPGKTPGASSSLAHRLEEAVARLDITHDELARRIGIGKTTYYAVKGGGGKTSTQLKVEQYLHKLNES